MATANSRPKPSGSDRDRLPPQNLEAEQSTLGSLMLEKNAIIKVADFLVADDFYKDSHRLIFEAMLELYENRDPIDVLSLSNKLKDRQQLDQVGGTGYLTTLVNTVPSAAHVEHYGKIVQEKATLRRLITASSSITALGYQENQNVDKLLDQAEQELFAVSQKHLKQNFIPLKSALAEAFERIDELHKQDGALRGLPTGFKDLDNLLGGLQKSDLVILASRPSLGKTSLALDICRLAALKGKAAVAVFSLEMSKDQLVDRLLCAEADVNLWKMHTGKLNDQGPNDEFSRIGNAMGELSNAQIFIDDAASSSIMEIRTKARRLHLEHNLGLIVVDYLQLMEGRTTDNRVQEVGEISRALKGLARELNVPVLALSQLSRAVESRSPQIPKLSDLRESGSIEQDADVVIFLYREDREKPNTERKNIVDIIISKHRNGPTGATALFFNEHCASFSSLDSQHAEENPTLVTPNSPPLAPVAPKTA